MEEKLDMILIKINKLQEEIIKLQHAMDAHRTEHSLQSGPGMQSGPPGFPPSGNTPGGYFPGGVPFGPPGM